MSNFGGFENIEEDNTYMLNLEMELVKNFDETILEKYGVLCFNSYEQYFVKLQQSFYQYRKTEKGVWLRFRILDNDGKDVDENILMKTAYKNDYELLKPKLLKYKLEKLLNDA